jgi:hypothetical protein
MDITKVPYFDYKIKKKQISLPNLHKLIYGTFICLKNLHDTGYYHGELGDENSILLEGTLDDWNKAIIINDEINKITNQDQIEEDTQTLAYMIWQIIVGDICIIEDKNEEGITPGHPKFIKLVKYSIKKFSNYSKYLKLLLWIFKTKPIITNIINKIYNI